MLFFFDIILLKLNADGINGEFILHDLHDQKFHMTRNEKQKIRKDLKDYE